MNAPLERQDVVVCSDISNFPSDARCEANRANAAKSTGPKTEEGKERSRRNALKHGLTGAGIVQPLEDEAKLHADIDKWLTDLNPQDEIERAMVKGIAIAESQIDRARVMEAAMRQSRVDRAENHWTQDQQLEVQRLADKLPKAKTPGLIVAELRQTPAGCDWLIERWQELDRALDLKEDWNDECRTMAFDLLGTPRAMREFSIDLPTDATLAEKRALAHRRIAALRNDRDQELDDRERDRVVNGCLWDDRPEARRLRSYDEKNTKRFHKLLDYFLKRMSGAVKRPAVDGLDEGTNFEAEDVEDEGANFEAEDVEDEGSAYGATNTRDIMLRAGLFPIPAGCSLTLDPALAALSAERLAELIAPPDCRTPGLLESIRDAMSRAKARGR